MARRNQPATTAKEKAARRARQLSGLRNQKRPTKADGTAVPPPPVGLSHYDASKPEVTPARAMEFVKLLTAGLPPDEALDYLFPLGDAKHASLRPRFTTKEKPKLWVKEWLTHPNVIKATSEFNGNNWEDMDSDRRIELALEHHYAQVAYFLYQSNYAIDAAPISKISDARSALLARIAARSGESSPFETMMRDLLEGKRGDTLLARPPQLGKGGIPVELVKEGKES